MLIFLINMLWNNLTIPDFTKKLRKIKHWQVLPACEAICFYCTVFALTWKSPIRLSNITSPHLNLTLIIVYDHNRSLLFPKYECKLRGIFQGSQSWRLTLMEYLVALLDIVHTSNVCCVSQDSNVTGGNSFARTAPELKGRNRGK